MEAASFPYWRKCTFCGSSAADCALCNDLEQLLAQLQHGFDALLPGPLEQRRMLRIALQGRFHGLTQARAALDALRQRQQPHSCARVDALKPDAAVGLQRRLVPQQVLAAETPRQAAEAVV